MCNVLLQKKVDRIIKNGNSENIIKRSLTRRRGFEYPSGNTYEYTVLENRLAAVKSLARRKGCFPAFTLCE